MATRTYRTRIGGKASAGAIAATLAEECYERTPQPRGYDKETHRLDVEVIVTVNFIVTPGKEE